MEQAPLSTIEVTSLPLDNIPRLLGEPDLIRMVQNLPGVKTDSDFTGGVLCAGAAASETRFCWPACRSRIRGTRLAFSARSTPKRWTAWPSAKECFRRAMAGG